MSVRNSWNNQHTGKSAKSEGRRAKGETRARLEILTVAASGPSLGVWSLPAVIDQNGFVSWFRTHTIGPGKNSSQTTETDPPRPVDFRIPTIHWATCLI